MLLESVYAQPQMIFKKETGAGPSSALNFLISPAENLFFSGGFITASVSSQTDGHLLRMNEKGDVIWEKKIDKGYNEKVISLISDNQDGIFALLSHSPDSLHPWKNRKTYLMHIDKEGNSLSETEYTEGKNLYPPLQLLPNGEILSIAYQKSSQDSSKTVSGIVSLSTKGQVIWQKNFIPDSGNVSQSAFVLLPDETFTYLSAVGFKPDSMDFLKYWEWNQEGLYLFRCKKDGTEISRKYLPPFAQISDIKPTKDGNFIVAGNRNVLSGTGDTEIDIILRKISVEGVMLWEKIIHIQKHDTPLEITELPSGNIILSAHCAGSWVNNTVHTALFEISSGGETIWGKVFRDGNCIMSVVQAKDRTYFATGLFSDTYVQKEEDSRTYSRNEAFESKSRFYHFTDNPVIWEMNIPSYGGSEQAYCLEKDNKNGFFISGIDFNGNQIFIQKTDENGNTVWKNNLEKWSASMEVPSGVTALPDGGCIAFNNKDNLFRISASGKILWENEPFKYKHISGIKPHTENRFLVAGSVWIDYPDNNLWWAFMDEDGKAISEKQKHFPLPVEVWDIEKCDDGGFVFACEAGEVGENIIQLIKIDEKGEYAWDELYPMGKNAEARGVVSLKSGGYAISGVSYDPKMKHRAVLIKTDSNGKKEWDLTLVKTESELFTTVVTADTSGNILLAATHKFNNYKGEQAIYVAKISEKGEILWEKFIDGAGSRQIGGIVLTHDNHILITGYSDYQTSHEHNPQVYLAKIRND